MKYCNITTVRGFNVQYLFHKANYQYKISTPYGALHSASAMRFTHKR